MYNCMCAVCITACTCIYMCHYRLWSPDPCPDRLYHAECCPPHTDISVERDPMLGKLLGFHEVGPPHHLSLLLHYMHANTGISQSTCRHSPYHTHANIARVINSLFHPPPPGKYECEWLLLRLVNSLCVCIVCRLRCRLSG